MMKKALILKFLLCLWMVTMTMAIEDEIGKLIGEEDEDDEEEHASVHVVYTNNLQCRIEGGDPKPFHVKTLSSVLGSEKAAQDALLYVYKTAACGFAAMLTPRQVKQILKLPGVLEVVVSRRFSLHTGPTRGSFKHHRTTARDMSL